MSLILGSGPTFAVLTMSSILQIMVSRGCHENYFMQFHLKTCHRSEKYKSKVISSHRLVNNSPGSRSGLNVCLKSARICLLANVTYLIMHCSTSAYMIFCCSKISVELKQLFLTVVTHSGTLFTLAYP